jgi:hypothetical protein
LGKYFGVKAELMGYETATWTATFPSRLVVTPPVVTPHGTTAIVPAGTHSARANMFTYQFGPVVRIPMKNATVFGDFEPALVPKPASREVDPPWSRLVTDAQTCLGRIRPDKNALIVIDPSLVSDQSPATTRRPMK